MESQSNGDSKDPISSVVIVGAGVFGAATALSLAKQKVQVTMIDVAPFPPPHAASRDLSKVVRDDYPDELYMRMMAEAMPKWRNDPLFKNCYHECGMLRADSPALFERSAAAYSNLGRSNYSELLSVEEVRRRWNGVFADTNFDGIDNLIYNPRVGITEGFRALTMVIEAGAKIGVRLVVGEMGKAIFKVDGTCIGVLLKSGAAIYADKVLLATGARTGSLLFQSAPDKPNLHVGARMTAAGALTFSAKLGHHLRPKFSGIPILLNSLPQVKGESMSMLPDGVIKFNYDMCFTNNVVVSPNGMKLSQPPTLAQYNTWTGPNFIPYLKAISDEVVKNLFGEASDEVQIQQYRICWDASTPTHDFLITAHPQSNGLYIATGGSFHGWKFLPVIGHYIASMMQGTLGQEYVDRWAWDKIGKQRGSANQSYDITCDFQDFI